MADGLDNIPQPELTLGRIKRANKTIALGNRDLKRALNKSLNQLERLVPLVSQALPQLGDWHDFKGELVLELTETKALLRDQGRKIN